MMLSAQKILERDGASKKIHPALTALFQVASHNRIGRMELKPTDLILRRRTDLGFTRDRHIKCASRLQPTCGAPSRRMAAGSVSLVAVLRDARNSALLRTRLIDRKTVMAAKDTARLSAKFQISIPKAIRTARRWRAGQVFAFIPKGEGMLLVPVPSLHELSGLARGAKTKGYRDRVDRI